MSLISSKKGPIVGYILSSNVGHRINPVVYQKLSPIVFLV